LEIIFVYFRNKKGVDRLVLVLYSYGSLN